MNVMENLKVVKIESESITFDNGFTLASNHEQDCCENHWLSFENLTIKDFEGLEFNLTNDFFFNRIPDFGIELLPINGWPIRVPGYGSNNGYYSSDLEIVIRDQNAKWVKRYDITECQVISQ
jgi:hypothetical protein